MGALDFAVFMGASMMIVAVMLGTLLPAWSRIVEALVNTPPAAAPRLVLARHRVTVDRRPPLRSQALREAA